MKYIVTPLEREVNFPFTKHYMSEQHRKFALLKKLLTKTLGEVVINIHLFLIVGSLVLEYIARGVNCLLL